MWHWCHQETQNMPFCLLEICSAVTDSDWLVYFSLDWYYQNKKKTTNIKSHFVCPITKNVYFQSNFTFLKNLRFRLYKTITSLDYQSTGFRTGALITFLCRSISRVSAESDRLRQAQHAAASVTQRRIRVSCQSVWFAVNLGEHIYISLTWLREYMKSEVKFSTLQRSRLSFTLTNLTHKTQKVTLYYGCKTQLISRRRHFRRRVLRLFR